MRKQLASYENDNSEETKAKVQQLKLELSKAEENLAETEYEKMISDSEKMLDSLFADYEEILNTRLDNIDGLLEQVVAGINAGMGSEGSIASALGDEGAIAQAIAGAIGENGSVKSILNTELSAVGSSLSQAMSDIWSTEGSGTNSILSTYGQGFQDRQTTTNETLNAIKISIDNMVSESEKEAEEKIEQPSTQPSTKQDPTKNSINESKTEDPSKTEEPKKEEPKTENPSKTQTPKVSEVVNIGAELGKKMTTSSGDGKAKVGDKVKFISGKYYASSDGLKPTGNKNLGKQVYITKINTKSWATHPYHISTGKKLGSGDLGWLKLKQLSGYASGKKNFLSDEVAWTQENGQEFIIRPSDGAILTPVAKGDSVLNAAASGNIWNMANNPAGFIRDNLNLGVASAPNNSNVQSNYTQHFENVTFHLPNVHSYDELLMQMKKDKNFERLVLSMSIDRVAGKSALAKGKSIR